MSIFDDGYCSFPNKRINYPNNIEDEKEWLKGYYTAESEYSIDTIDETDNFLWYYKKG